VPVFEEVLAILGRRLPYLGAGLPQLRGRIGLDAAYAGTVRRWEQRDELRELDLKRVQHPAKPATK